MKCIVIILLLFQCYNCKKDCSQREELSFYFHDAISAIEGNDKGSSINTSNAFIFLDILTGVKPNVKGGHWGLYYDKEQDMLNDILAWNKWYKNEVCGLNLYQLDSNYQQFIKKHQSETVTFPEDWKKLFEGNGWGY